MTLRSGWLTLGLALFMLSNAAVAHPGHEPAGFLSALVHPLTGLDHVLAMLAVGLWAGSGQAAQSGEISSTIRLPLLLPASFVSACGLGTWLGFCGLFGPSVEVAVAASLLPLGLALLFRLADSSLVAVALALACGSLHGAAHGTELAGQGSASVLEGFLLGTAMLHVAGLVLALRLPRALRTATQRVFGLGMTAAGVFLLA